MEDKEYLLNGDLKLLAERLNVSENHLRLVSQGNRKNKRIEDAINGLIAIRKKELAEVLKSFETKKDNEICHTNGMENL